MTGVRPCGPIPGMTVILERRPRIEGCLHTWHHVKRKKGGT
jgi:hypothetical protein